MTAYSTENIPPKPPRTTEKKYLIYRILTINRYDERTVYRCRYYTDNLEEIRADIKERHMAKRVLFSYHEKEE